MSKVLSPQVIHVGLDFGGGIIPVGLLAMRDQRIYFEYIVAFLEQDIEISPLRLPLKPGLFSFDAQLFEGLPGVLNDSLPDGWGRLLFDRYARSQGRLVSGITPLDRLAHVGNHGMGALVYEPNYTSHNIHTEFVELDELAEQAKAVLIGNSDDVLQTLLALNGSSAGARPKALIGLDITRCKLIHGVTDLPSDYEPWLVKFTNTQDTIDSGAIEFVYALMAKDAGINMPLVHLFPAQYGPGFFAVQRFDRNAEKKIHMHTVCGLLHTDFRVPALDYEDLIALTMMLTRDVREVEKMFRLAVFNVLAHNRDDHAKNFSFLMNEQGQWRLAPGYDLTFSSGPGGEQSTMVMGEGRNPKGQHLIQLGKVAEISKDTVVHIIDQTRSALAQWQQLAKQYNVSSTNIKTIHARLRSID